MIKFFKKYKLNIITSLFCAFAMALFTVISFSCKTYAYTIDNNGNLVGDNLLNLDSYIDKSNNVSISNYSIIFESINNTTYDEIIVQFYDSNRDYLTTLGVFDNNTTTSHSFIKDSSYKYLVIARNGNVAQSRILFDIDILTNNYNYTISMFVSVAQELYINNIISTKIMLNEGTFAKEWEPYGVWYSETNYDTIDNLYDNALSQYNDLILGNNYGYWKYIDYVEFYVNNSNIFVPNTNEQNEWEISDLYNNNILKIGGYFDTFPLTMEPYQSDYNEVDTYINFKANTPSDSFIVTFNNCDGCNVVINDDNSNSFTTTISETNYLIDINEIRKYIPNFSIYIIEMYISPNTAEQNGIYFANNDYITAYNKGYNVATSNADRKYIPQITDLQNQINSLNNNIIELSNNIDTLRALNTDLQNQINNSYSWQNLFFAFADTPFKVVSNVLGFELFGLNLFATFIGMITVFGVVYLLKKFL